MPSPLVCVRVFFIAHLYLTVTFFFFFILLQGKLKQHSYMQRYLCTSSCGADIQFSSSNTFLHRTIVSNDSRTVLPPEISSDVGKNLVTTDNEAYDLDDDLAL
jgi:hypothetical protein